MTRLLRPVLVLLLVLLPLRGWAQAVMTGQDCADSGHHVAATMSHHVGAMPDMDGCTHHAAGDAPTSDQDDGANAHCVICHLAVAEPPALQLAAVSAALQPCPAAVATPWHDAERRRALRPPQA